MREKELCVFVRVSDIIQRHITPSRNLNRHTFIYTYQLHICIQILSVVQTALVSRFMSDSNRILSCRLQKCLSSLSSTSLTGGGNRGLLASFEGRGRREGMALFLAMVEREYADRLSRRAPPFAFRSAPPPRPSLSLFAVYL